MHIEIISNGFPFASSLAIILLQFPSARLAQSVEHETLNLRVVGSSPTLGDIFLPTFVLGLDEPFKV